MDDLANVDVPRDMLQEQQFEIKFESYTEQVMLYHEELTKIVALSVVPEHIHKITGQVDQLKALLEWFKKDFFTWTNCPNCTRCGVNTNMEDIGGQ